MMPASLYASHNQDQCDYFAGPPKKTMIPRSSPYVERQITRVLAAADIRPGDRILEVGCGMGRYTLPLVARGVRVEGQDLSPVLLDRLREFGGDGFDLPLHCGDISTPPQAWTQAFDVVLGFFVLHHIHDLTPTFAAVARVLRPGGRVVFVEPNPYNPLYYAQILLTPGMRWTAERGMVRMRRSVITRACAQAGLTGVSVERFGFFPPFIANRPWGGVLERALERVPIWRPVLPTQLFKAHRP